MVFLDVNIPMYLVGTDHPLKVESGERLEQLAFDRDELVTDAEVFQEIVHRYASQNRHTAIPKVFELTEMLVRRVFPISFADTKRAAVILAAEPRLAARDAIHIAVMERHGVRRILSFDKHFDYWPGITRIGS